MLRVLVVALALLASVSSAHASPWNDTMPLIATACATANFAPLMGWALNSGSIPISIVSTLGATIPGMTEIDRQSVAAGMAASGCVIPPKPPSVVAWEGSQSSGGSGSDGGSGGGSTPPPATCALSDPRTWTRVYVVGDSISRVTNTKPSPCANCTTSAHTWVNMLGEWTTAEVVNLAAPGATSANVVASSLPTVLAGGGHALIAHIGHNDPVFGITSAQTQANITALIDAPRAAGMDVVIIGLGPQAQISAAQWSAVNAAVVAAAAGACVRYFDGLAPFRSLYATPARDYDTDDIPDGTHYSPRGARKRAEQIGRGLFQ